MTFFFFYIRLLDQSPTRSSHTPRDTLLAPAAHGTDAQKQKAIFPLSQSSDKDRRIQVPGFIFTICLNRQELCPGTETARAGSADFLGLTAPFTSLHHLHYSTSPTFERGETTSTKHPLRFLSFVGLDSSSTSFKICQQVLMTRQKPKDGKKASLAVTLGGNHRRQSPLDNPPPSLLAGPRVLQNEEHWAQNAILITQDLGMLAAAWSPLI